MTPRAGIPLGMTALQLLGGSLAAQSTGAEAGRVSREIEATGAIWEFFQLHPRS